MEFIILILTVKISSFLLAEEKEKFKDIKFNKSPFRSGLTRLGRRVKNRTFLSSIKDYSSKILGFCRFG